MKTPYFSIPKWHVIFYLGYGIIFAGWLFHRSADSFFGPYNGRYLVFLLSMAVLFLLPTTVSFTRRRIGTKGIIFSLIPAFLLVPLVYFSCSFWYYHHQLHPFDPFLQNKCSRIGATVSSDDQETSGKSAGREIRVLALGGSTTECGALESIDRYPAILERLLRQRFPDCNIVVFNGGKSWYSSRHSLINYSTYYYQWQPDVVIVMHAINDVIRSFAPEELSLGQYDPLYSHSYGPAIKGAKPPPFEKYLYERFLRDLVLRAGATWFSVFRNSGGNQLVDFPLSHYRSITPFSENMQRLCQLAKWDGATVAVVTQPMLYKKIMTKEEQDALQFAGWFCVETGADRVAKEPSAVSMARAHAAFTAAAVEAAARTDAVLIDAATHVPADLEHFVDDCHYTPRGAAKLASIVAEHIEHVIDDMLDGSAGGNPE